jgi:hypothetical protein
VNGCNHDELRQISTLTAKTTWIRSADGFHTPEAEINQVLEEETALFECVECGERVEPETSS